MTISQLELSAIIVQTNFTKRRFTTFAMFFGGGGRSIYAPGRRMGVGYTIQFLI